MSAPILSQDFFEHIDHQLELLKAKDEAFLRRLEALRESFGGGDRLAGELSMLESENRAFAQRVRDHDWQGYAAGLRVELTGAFAAQAPAVDDANTLAFYWNGELAEVCARGPIARARQFKRQNAVLGFDALFDALCTARSSSSSAYPIIFSHDAERNRRAVLAAIGATLAQYVIASALKELGCEGVAVRFALSTKGEQRVVYEPSTGRLDAWLIDARALGFESEREIERQLEAFVELDGQANFNHYLASRMHGVLEQRDLVEPTGRTWRAQLERSEHRIVLLSRERPIMTRKRANRFVDSSPVVREEICFASESEAEQAHDRLIRDQIERGFRIVFESVLDKNGGKRHRGDAPLSWQDDRSQ
ncbi:MAG: hypothetical protein H0U74_13410 [Bradymonadaceae bacterium]|nr:hypothetical protein [Lujinxingiaceae bacterium]